uniref:Histidine-rich glycoprotein n=1 Tax=Ursus americanus TaxID=9643 RepID=A0A452RLF2_URSAM
MRAFSAALFLLPLIALQNAGAVSPEDCDATEPFAAKVLDLINKERRHGYLFQLLRVADAHLDKVESAAVYYLVLDVKESDCSVLSRKHWDDCAPALSKRVSDIVIGQCKVLATQCLNDTQYFRVMDYNCTTSSVSSALANNKDSPVVFDFVEDTESYRTLADRALEKYREENGDFASFRVDRVERVVRGRGGERTTYYVDFSVRNCSSSRHFPRHHNAPGFCRADLSYEVGASDLENPEDIAINCEVFNFEECRNFSGHPFHSGGHKHFAGKAPFKPDEFRGHHPPHKPHKFGCPPFPEDRPPLPPPGSRCHHPHFGKSGTHGHPHNNSSSENHPHGPPPHGPPPHGHHPHGDHPHGPPPHGHHPHGDHPHGPPPHGHHPHGHHPHGPPPHGHHPHGHHPHGPPPHGHHPHGHHPHGPPPHGHHPHGHRPHGHRPHGHDFLDHGPCDPPPHSQGPEDHPRWGHGPPSRHSEERGPGKRHFPFHWRQIGYVYRLPPLKEGEVLPLPDADFPSFSLPDDKNPLAPEIQPFPQSVSESCPGAFRSEFSHISQFFAYSLPK